jgi:P-type Cu+ transporter
MHDNQPSQRRTVAGHTERMEDEMERDPVCGMNVDPHQAAGQSEYQGKTYYFCAAGCKRKFDGNPQQYVK